MICGKFMTVIRNSVTKENVVDMAWKTEGLPKLMKDRGDDRAPLLR